MRKLSSIASRPWNRSHHAAIFRLGVRDVIAITRAYDGNKNARFDAKRF